MDYNVNGVRWSCAVWRPCSSLSLLVILFTMVSLGPLTQLHNLSRTGHRLPCFSAPCLPCTDGHRLAQLVPLVSCGADPDSCLAHLGEHQQHSSSKTVSFSCPHEDSPAPSQLCRPGTSASCRYTQDPEI